MSSDLLYRTATAAECEYLAEMIYMASGGVVEFLFHGLVQEMTPVQIIAANMAREGPGHSYQNATVAVCQESLAGMTLAFPADHHYISAEMRDFFPADRLYHLEDFYAARLEDSLLLDALCVAKSYRRRGIGNRLIDMVKSQAVASGFSNVSLIVFADNTAALPLYRQEGFEVVRPVALAAHELIPHEGGCLLMKCEL